MADLLNQTTPTAGLDALMTQSPGTDVNPNKNFGFSSPYTAGGMQSSGQSMGQAGGMDLGSLSINFNPAGGQASFAKGGLASAADRVQARGRGNDTMLMHVTPREVAGLQALAKAHGGSLTINPNTGLVEAGFLDNLLPSILPMVAGAALASTGIGAPAAAMLVGGGYGLATGSVEKGLMAGLGAYGGAGIGEGLAAASTNQAATNAAQAGAIPQATTAGGTAITPSVDAGTQALGAASGNAPVATTQMPYAPTATGQVSPVVNQMAAGQGAGATASVNPRAFTFDQLQSGASNTFGSMDTAGKFVGENYGKIGMAAAPAMAAAMEPEPYEPPEKKKSGLPSYTLSKDFQGYVPRRPSPYYTPTGLGYAGGGLANIMMASGGSFDDEIGQDSYAKGGKAKAKPTGERNLANMEALDATMADLNNARYGANMSQTELPKAGIAALGNIPYTVTAAQGRYLKGNGDGMSDSIPATINGHQPARLADGEFVVPADVVSHLGNGSSDAGAKKLYSMMDKIRTARTGKKRQAPAVRADKYMPA